MRIEANSLREWLDGQQPVTVLDIRTDEGRAQWAIPGSVHVNAYEALRAGQPGALTDAAFPADRPVATVCNAGRVSQRARALFGSLTRLRALHPHTAMLAAHASEPLAFDGRAVAARLGDVETWLSGWLATEAAFVERVTLIARAEEPEVDDGALYVGIDGLVDGAVVGGRHRRAGAARAAGGWLGWRIPAPRRRDARADPQAALRQGRNRARGIPAPLGGFATVSPATRRLAVGQGTSDGYATTGID